MNGIYDGYSVKTGRDLWFAGANTGRGFVGSYDAIADEERLERLYILKGGPGTGKSTLLRRIGQAAENAGFPAESFLCGSDPDSLDCVVLDGRIAVLDGTPPHPLEMKYPGAASELEDMSRFWDGKILTEQRSRIEYHAAEKAAAYASAYRWIAAAEQIESEKYALAASVFRREKAAAFLGRFLRKLGKQTGSPRRTERWTHGITMRGRIAVSSLSEGASAHFRIADPLGIAPVFLDLLAETLEDAGFSKTFGRIPLSNRISGVFLPDQGVSVTAGAAVGDCRILNMSRFTEKELPEGLKGRLKLSQKCLDSCLSAADESLAQAAAHHFALEAIYKPAMDFAALERYADRLEKEILRRLCKKSV